jgi:Protein of unknown function (DUF4019)
MSAEGPPQGTCPLGGAARSDARRDRSAAGPPQGTRPLGGTARSGARGNPTTAAGGGRSSRRRALALLACALLLPQVAVAQDPRAAAVQRAAREWLALVDKLDAEASWKAAGERFQQSTPPSVWVETLKGERAPRGALQQRAVTATSFGESGPGLPEGGSYALVTFRSSFANQSDSREEVTLEVGPDYAWRVIGYVIL